MIRFFIAVLFISCNAAFSAGPVAHVYLAEKFFEVYPKYGEEEKKRFILGTLFPDIRYVSEIDRTHTHDEDVTLQEVLQQASPFVAGMKFHAWVDNVRDDYVLSDEIYDRLPGELTIVQKPSFLKVIEDELLLDKIDTEYYSKILEIIDPEELEQGVSKNEVQLWHAFLMFFFKTSPSTTITLLSLIDTGRSHPKKEDMEMWMSLINPVIESSVGINHTINLESHIKNKMIEEKQLLNESTIVEVNSDEHSEQH